MIIQLTPDKIGGSVTIPPSKSMAHRSFLAAALATGTSTITNIVYSQDMDATLAAVAQLGATVVRLENSVEITGNGGVFPPVTQPVDCIESGSTLRFLIPLFTLAPTPVTFCGRGRLMQRPQEIYKDLFIKKGLTFDDSDQTITIDGNLTAGEYTINGGVSSQFITGLLYTLPLLDGDSIIKITPPFESRSYVNLTLQVLADFGICVNWQDDYTLSITGHQSYKPQQYKVEGDCSQAAFFAVLGAISGNITLEDIRQNTLQGDYVIFDILKRCGASFTIENGNYIFTNNQLNGCTIDLADCPDLGPILMVLGLFCNGTTVIKNAGRLRVKESDRIEAMHSEIKKLGGSMEVSGDTITLKTSTLTSSDNLDSSNDHRIVMALSVASMAGNFPIQISQAQAINKSYPDFFTDATSCGAKITVIQQ